MQIMKLKKKQFHSLLQNKIQAEFSASYSGVSGNIHSEELMNIKFNIIKI